MNHFTVLVEYENLTLLIIFFFRSIARLIDQIRLFKQMRYAFEANDDLAARLRARIVECREENLHALAAENSANFHMSSSQSSRKFQEAFKKMKATFGNG